MLRLTGFLVFLAVVGLAAGDLFAHPRDPGRGGEPGGRGVAGVDGGRTEPRPADNGAGAGSSKPKEAPTAGGAQGSVSGTESAKKERDPDAALKENITDVMKAARDRGEQALLTRVRDRAIAAARVSDNHDSGDGGELPASRPPPALAAENAPQKAPAADVPPNAAG